jgi:hypothetical protein
MDEKTEIPLRYKYNRFQFGGKAVTIGVSILVSPTSQWRALGCGIDAA